MFGGDDTDNPFFAALQQLQDTNKEVSTVNRLTHFTQAVA